jgi:hypothetical protein
MPQKAVSWMSIAGQPVIIGSEWKKSREKSERKPDEKLRTYITMIDGAWEDENKEYGERGSCGVGRQGGVDPCGRGGTGGGAGGSEIQFVPEGGEQEIGRQISGIGSCGNSTGMNVRVASTG